MRLTPFFLLALILGSGTSSAGLINYAFTGEHGLSGQVVLDDSGFWDLEPTTMDGLAGTLTSPFQGITGSMGNLRSTVR